MASGVKRSLSPAIHPPPCTSTDSPGASGLGSGTDNVVWSAPKCHANGVTRDQLNALNPAIVHYIGHLHVATAGFIAATGIAVAALSWYGVRRGEWWAWIAAVVSPVVGLAVALPYHYTGTFEHDWVTHLGPIYVATLVFVVGAVLALRAMTRRT